MRNALFILLFGVCLGACSHSVVTEASYHVVPLPQQIEINQKGEGFTLTHHTQLTVGDEVLKTSVGYFAQQLQQLIGMNLSVKEESTKDEKDGIHFELGLLHENKEAYTIQVDGYRYPCEGSYSRRRISGYTNLCEDASAYLY